MKSIHYYFDESGEKGFVRPNFSPSEIGLVAGIALQQSAVPDFEADTSHVLSKLDAHSVSKLHATEMFKDGANASIKAELLELLQTHQEWYLVYEAVYPLGLHKYNASLSTLCEKHESDNPRVRYSGNKKKHRIYTELLEGIIIKLDEICHQCSIYSIEMCSDRIDTGLFKEADSTLNMLKQREHSQKTSGFDTQTKDVVHGSVLSRVLGFDTTVNYVTDIKTEVRPSTMTIAADIVANTLYRHLKSAVATLSSPQLHSNAAVEGFILKDRIAFIDDNYIMDKLYSPHG